MSAELRTDMMYLNIADDYFKAKKTGEYLTKQAKFAEIGIRVVPDFKKKTMTFETYKGVARTQAQCQNP